MTTAPMEQATSISPSNQLNAHIASGCFTAYGTEMKMTMRRNAPQNIQDDSGTGSVFHDEKYEVDDDDDGVEPITLPESTHSFLFSEPICSLGFLFSAFIVLLSYASLLLALVNNITHGKADNPLNVPYNVTFDVRISQYLGAHIHYSSFLFFETNFVFTLFFFFNYFLSNLHRPHNGGRNPHGSVSLTNDTQTISS